jgi:predicted RNase H-like HicB family nuclease
MNLRVEFEREEDGRWLAEISDLLGVMAYGESREEAAARVQALALRVIADRLEHGETEPEMMHLSFVGA